jgi:hypothetical protein
MDLFPHIPEQLMRLTSMGWAANDDGHATKIVHARARATQHALIEIPLSFARTGHMSSELLPGSNSLVPFQEVEPRAGAIHPTTRARVTLDET